MRSGTHIQGDAFTHQGPVRFDYRFLGQAGWEYLAAYDHTGLIWERNLHQEVGFSDRLVRVRWGGARIQDRYRWAAWQGRIRVLNGTIHRFGGHRQLMRGLPARGERLLERRAVAEFA